MILASLCPNFAHADDAPAFAAAISPQSAFETCLSSDAVKAADCALKKCVGAGGTECVITSACTSGWAGVMDVNAEEIGWTDTVCGAPSEAAALAALKAYCKGELPSARTCILVSVYSPDGKEKKIGKKLDPRAIK